MADRLKQIWGGFEKTTTRRLSGRGVDHIVVPSRHDYQATDDSALPQNFTAPAEAAFAALKGKLSAQEKKFARKAAGRSGEAPPAPLSPEAEFERAPEGARDLIRGLKATEARVSRRMVNYADSPEARAAGRRRRLFKLF